MIAGSGSQFVRFKSYRLASGIETRRKVPARGARNLTISLRVQLTMHNLLAIHMRDYRTTNHDVLRWLVETWSRDVHHNQWLISAEGQGQLIEMTNDYRASLQFDIRPTSRPMYSPAIKAIESEVGYIVWFCATLAYLVQFSSRI